MSVTLTLKQPDPTVPGHACNLQHGHRVEGRVRCGARRDGSGEIGRDLCLGQARVSAPGPFYLSGLLRRAPRWTFTANPNYWRDG
jgi:hypothetical protein